MKTNKFLTLSLSIFISTNVFLNLSPAWGGKEEYDIACEEQVFNEPSLNRNWVHISRYTPDTEVTENPPSIIFLHGGPEVKNEGQFDQFISQFTNNGFNVYVPEIIGSSYYPGRDGMDANEYKQNYRTDIQAVINHMEENSPGKKYAITHSLGCHQLLRFLSHPESKFNFEAASTIGGAWDLGANRLFATTKGKNWKDFPRNHIDLTLMSSTQRSCLGIYAKLEGDEKPMTRSYNVGVDRELNKRFSVLYQVDQSTKIPPLQLIHAKDDKQVSFSLSLKMFEALKFHDHTVAGYFLSTGDHGFIKNPLDSTAPDTTAGIRQHAAENILDFFAKPEAASGSIYFDGQVTEIQNISIDHDALKEHQQFLEEYHNNKL
jgi:alpha-beta hydrolase superfamily lysophospholipase